MISRGEILWNLPFYRNQIFIVRCRIFTFKAEHINNLQEAKWTSQQYPSPDSKVIFRHQNTMATVVDSSSLAKFVALHHTDGTCVIIPSACNAAYSFNVVSIPGGSINLWKTSVRQLFFVLLKTANQPLICSKSRISTKFYWKSKLRCWTSSMFFSCFRWGHSSIVMLAKDPVGGAVNIVLPMPSMRSPNLRLRDQLPRSI